MLCNKCNNVWFPVANNLMRGHKCICNKPNKNISHNKFLERLSYITEEIEIISDYKGSKFDIECKCKYCGAKWTSTPNKLMRGVGINCPACSPKNSLPNRYMYNLLSQLDIEFEKEKVFNWSNSKRYDFYIPCLNMIIEMNGKQHYSGLYFDGNNEESYEKIHANDVYKKELALNNGVRYYIEVNASNSNLCWLKRHVLKDQYLSDLLKSCDFEYAYKRSNVSPIVSFANHYNSGITDYKDLADINDIAISTVYTYMSTAKKCGLIA